VVIFLEDIHWSDDSSLDVVNALSSSTQQFPLLIICLARPTLYERRPYWGEGLEYHTRFELIPLSKSESRQLVTEILRRSVYVPPKLRELLVSSAEGNPFYIEELIKMLIDSGVIITGAESWRVETDQLGNVDVPSTLTGVLQARLDSLPSHEKLILQQASVVGRTFWDSTVKHINASIEREQKKEKPEIADHLTNLRSKEMIYRREESTFTDSSEFIFKHAILRDVTYDSVLKKLRRIYHQLVAEWLIQQSGERGGEYAGLIGEHLLLAGKNREATKFFISAAEIALRGYANKEAEQFFRKALDLSPPSSDQVSLLSGLGISISRQSRYKEAATIWEQAIAMSREQKDTDQVSRLYAYLARNAWHTDDIKKGLRIALEGLNGVQDAPDSPGKAILLHEAAAAYHYNGKNDLAESYTRQAIKLADELSLYDVKADALSTLGVLPGVPIEEKRGALEQAIQLAEENGMLLKANRAYNNLGTLYYYFLAEIKKAHDCFLKAADIAQQIAITHQEIYNRANLATALTDMGKLRDAQKQIELIEDLQKQIPDPESINLWVEKSRGFLTGQMGAWEEARSICQKGLSEARKHNNLSFFYFFASYLTYLYLELDRFSNRQNLAETLEIIQEAIELSDLGMGGTVWCRCFKLSVLIRLGNLKDSREFISEIQKLTSSQGFDPEYYFLLYSKAELADAEGQLTEAISIFQELFDYYASSDLQWEWARIALDMGNCHAKRGHAGDFARARELFAQSSDLFSETGATGYRQIAQERLREISHGPDIESEHG
jgi:predicted ATPase